MINKDFSLVKLARAQKADIVMGGTVAADDSAFGANSQVLNTSGVDYD